MLARAGTLLFTVVLASGALWAQQDAYLGTWKINLAKSKISTGAPPPQSMTTKREASGAKGMKYSEDSVNAQGQSRHREFTANYDGKDYPVKGDPNNDAASLKRVDARAYEFTYKKGGKVTGSGRAVASPDGKTLTITTQQGNLIVFDKQ